MDTVEEAFRTTYDRYNIRRYRQYQAKEESKLGDRLTQLRFERVYRRHGPSEEGIELGEEMMVDGGMRRV